MCVLCSVNKLLGGRNQIQSSFWDFFLTVIYCVGVVALEGAESQDNLESVLFFYYLGSED